MTDTVILPRTRKRRKKKKELQDPPPKRQPPYNVILLNDDDHTYEYVINMLMAIFGYPPEKGFQMAEEVDKQGRVIVLTTTKEHAELKRDQIHAFGPDPLLARCKGSMSAVIEPAPG
jgi:ATP-dependent Clp protease adaptor protein ClpS